jgi:AbrB family looped-hinge helix DNA binding protein
MAVTTARAQVSSSGRLSIPADMRRELGLEKGGFVSLRLDDEGLHLETAHQFIKRIQKMAREDGLHQALSVDDFIAWRRDEARREEEEMSAK